MVTPTGQEPDVVGGKFYRPLCCSCVHLSLCPHLFFLFSINRHEKFEKCEKQKSEGARK